MKRASVNGITIAYDDVGSGTDALLFVHGHPFNRSMWRPQIEALRGSTWRVIAPDLRGYGESSVVPGKTTLDVFATDLAALLDHLNQDQVVLVGLSMGGQIVMEFCRQYSTRVRGVVLAATSPVAEAEDGKRARNAMADRLLREGMDGYAAEVLAKMVAPSCMAEQPSVAAHVLAMMRGTDPHGAAAALRGRAERPAYEPTLAELSVPALICVGDEDVFTTRADAELMQRLLRRSELLWLNGVGHMPNLERRAEFNVALAHFLAGVPAMSLHTIPNGENDGS
jgi:pimeloyl-ACP methyl ester carboxylesterase